MIDDSAPANGDQVTYEPTDAPPIVSPVVDAAFPAHPSSHLTSGLLVPAGIADTLPSLVRAELAKMPAERQAQFVEEYQRKAKNVGVAYICWLFVGLHYAYLGKWPLQIVLWITWFGLGLWWLVDAFRIPGMVRDFNMDVATNVMRDIKIMGA